MANLPSTVVSSVQKLVGIKISVVSPETELQAREYLASVRKELKAFKASVVEVKKPFKKEIDEIDAASKPWIESSNRKTKRLSRRSGVSPQGARGNGEVQPEGARSTKKVATVEAKAIANGKPMPIVLPPAMASAPPKTVELEGAKQTVVKHKKWRFKKSEFVSSDMIQDPSKLDARYSSEQGLDIPLEFFCLDTAKIGKVVRAGGTIPGIEVYEEEVISQRAL